jgi:uncharacterized membrane protein YpjA
MNRMFFSLALVNFIAFAYGLYYYSGQLSEWNPVFWMFIIDCPLQVLFAGFIFLKMSGRDEKINDKYLNRNEVKGRENEFEQFVNFVSVGAIKYGIWTIAVIIIYSNYFLVGQDSLEYLMLLIAHFGLFLEGVYFTGGSGFSRKWILISFGFYLLNDLLDYIIGTHPLIPNEKIGFIATMTVGLTFLSVFLVKYLGEKKIKIIKLKI